MPIRRGRPTCAIKKRRHLAEVDRFLVLGPPCRGSGALHTRASSEVARLSKRAMSSKAVQLSDLPPEAFELVFAKLSRKDLARAARVCRGWLAEVTRLNLKALVLSRLPLELRARAACVSRDWRDAAAHPSLWTQLNLEQCDARVDDEALKQLLAHAGATLRTLSVDSSPFRFSELTAAGVVAALRDGGCIGVKRLKVYNRTSLNHACVFPLTSVQELAAACPALEFSDCAVRCSLEEAATVSNALPGPLSIVVTGGGAVNLQQLQEFLIANAQLATLGTLDFREVSVGTAGATHLAAFLGVNSSLTRLSLVGNEIGDDGVALLAGALHSNAALEELVLTGNDISHVGATALGASLCSNTTLKLLFLNGNPVSDAGAVRFAECLRVNDTLQHLSLSNCRIHDAGATQVAVCLRNNSALTKLSLAKNSVGHAGATELANCLRFNSTLTDLSLAFNDLGGVGAARLVDMLRRTDPINTTLAVICLAFNGIDVASRRALRAARRKSCLLELVEDTDWEHDAEQLESEEEDEEQ